MSRIPEPLRQKVIERANGCCEYCLISNNDVLLSHEVDHIIARKHRGKDELDNLCYACFNCNRHKQSDFASFDPETDEVAFLYNPRKDTWDDHFRLNGAMIEPLTPIGRVTVFVLDFNDQRRIMQRNVLIEQGRYPCLIRR